MSKLDHVQVLPLSTLRPAPENDNIYGAISMDDPAIRELAISIRDHGLQEPIVVSRDGYIISGHRRYVAARLAGLERISALVSPVSRTNDPEEFLKLIVECNAQRVKSASVILNEELLKIDPATAHKQIINDRKTKDTQRRDNTLSAIDPADDGQRCEISPAKMPMIDAIRRVLDEQREYWPLSDRQIHYRLLGENAPLIHASKRDSVYQNDKTSYRALTDVLTRGRIAGLIPWNAIEDSTRPTDLSSAFRTPAEFFQQEIEGFLTGYWRDLLQSQPHHIEIVAEKLTVRTILERVARQHTMPLTISRGMSSLPPKKAIHDRYRRSGKSRLILLVVSDLDPAGDAIAEDLVKSFRRDFGISKIEAYKVALTIEQVEAFGLTPSMEAKTSSPTYAAFVERYGITHAYELEALEPTDLAAALTSAIEAVLDIDKFNQELTAEEADSAQIVAVRRQVEGFLQSLNLGR